MVPTDKIIIEIVNLFLYEKTPTITIPIIIGIRGLLYSLEISPNITVVIEVYTRDNPIIVAVISVLIFLLRSKRENWIKIVGITDIYTLSLFVVRSWNPPKKFAIIKTISIMESIFFSL